MNFQEKMARFFYGRNGVDQLAKLFVWISLILIVISSILKNGIIYLVAIACLGYSWFRLMSRNLPKRSEENRRYMAKTQGIRNRVNQIKVHLTISSDQRARERSKKKLQRATEKAQKAEYKFFKCPACKQKVRVPRGHGKISITCPRCKTEFVRKS